MLSRCDHDNQTSLASGHRVCNVRSEQDQQV